MKKLLFIILSIVISFTMQAQSAMVHLDASGSGVKGGRGDGKIVSSTWTVVNPPGAVTYYLDSLATKPTTNKGGLNLWAKITVAGTYDFGLLVVDNLNNTKSGTMRVVAYGAQVIYILFASPLIEVDLKQ